MGTNTKGRVLRLCTWGGLLMGFTLLLTFRLQAQATHAQTENKKQGSTPAYEQPHAGSGIFEMDGITRDQLKKAQMQLENAQKKLMQKDWYAMEAAMARAKTQAAKVFQENAPDLAGDQLQMALKAMEKSLAARDAALTIRMKKVRAEIKHAQADIESMQQAIQRMEKDGLVEPGASLHIGWQNERLFINGKKQTKKVSEQYRGFFKTGVSTRKKTVI